MFFCLIVIISSWLQATDKESVGDRQGDPVYFLNGLQIVGTYLLFTPRQDSWSPVVWGNTLEPAFTVLLTEFGNDAVHSPFELAFFSVFACNRQNLRRDVALIYSSVTGKQRINVQKTANTTSRQKLFCMAGIMPEICKTPYNKKSKQNYKKSKN